MSDNPQKPALRLMITKNMPDDPKHMHNRKLCYFQSKHCSAVLTAIRSQLLKTAHGQIGDCTLQIAVETVLQCFDLKTALV